MDTEKYLTGSPFEVYKNLKIYEEKDYDDINIIVLTNKKDEENGLYKTASRIKEECEKRKIDCYIVFVEEAYITKDEKEVRIFNLDDKKGFKLDSDKTVAIIRGSVTRFKSSLNLISQLEKNNIFCVNTRECIEMCSDKYRTILKLSDSGINCPKTTLIRGQNGLEFALDYIGGKFPVILKTLTGSKGIGVFYAESLKSLKSVVQVIWKINEYEELLIQQYIPTEYDVRVHVLGEEVIASMKRYVIKDDFRSNFSLGGKVDNIKLSNEVKDICVRASKSIGGIWSGVDFIYDKKNEPYIIEINSSPGTSGIEKATKLNIVSMIIDFVSNKYNWVKVSKECGFREIIDVDGIGKIEAKFDTGNGSLCVLHSDKYEIDEKKKIVYWEHTGKKFKHEYKKIKEVSVGGLRDYKEDRPVVELDVEFDGVIYKKVDFTLDDRDGRTPVLINRRFMRKANITINPSKVFLLTKKEEK